MGTKKTITTKKTACANCCASLPGPYGTPGVSLARFDNKTLLCSKCGIAEAFSNAREVIPVSKWFQDTIDSHSIYSHRDIARKFLQETGQLADWPVATYKETVQSMHNDPRGGTMERGLKDQLVCYGWVMARHMARKLVNHQSHMMGRGYEFRDCVTALAKGGF